MATNLLDILEGLDKFIMVKSFSGCSHSGKGMESLLSEDSGWVLQKYQKLGASNSELAVLLMPCL